MRAGTIVFAFASSRPVAALTSTRSGIHTPSRLPTAALTTYSSRTSSLIFLLHALHQPRMRYVVITDQFQDLGCCRRTSQIPHRRHPLAKME
jgi:hypothetical protein